MTRGLLLSACVALGAPPAGAEDGKKAVPARARPSVTVVSLCVSRNPHEKNVPLPPMSL
jgi:hypothetical protein